MVYYPAEENAKGPFNEVYMSRIFIKPSAKSSNVWIAESAVSRDRQRF